MKATLSSVLKSAPCLAPILLGFMTSSSAFAEPNIDLPPFDVKCTQIDRTMKSRLSIQFSVAGKDLNSNVDFFYASSPEVTAEVVASIPMGEVNYIHLPNDGHLGSMKLSAKGPKKQKFELDTVEIDEDTAIYQGPLKLNWDKVSGGRIKRPFGKKKRSSHFRCNFTAVKS